MNIMTYLLRFLSVSLVCSISLLLGCSDYSSGESGNSHWKIADGLCPEVRGALISFSNYCSLDVAVVPGASVTIVVDSLHGSPAAHDIVSTGPEAVIDGAPTASDNAIDIRVTAVSVGDPTLQLIDGAGDVEDSIRLRIREPATMRCGVVSSNARYDDNDLTAPTEAVPVLISDVQGVQLSCVLSSSEGESLLAADAIDWELTAGADLVDLSGGSSIFAGDTQNGSRIYARGIAEGSATVTARYRGTLSSAIELTVAP